MVDGALGTLVGQPGHGRLTTARTPAVRHDRVTPPFRFPGGGAPSYRARVRMDVRDGGTGMSRQDDEEREFDLRWADRAEHKEPSARARMLAARWKENPPQPVPFRADPGPVARRRSPWLSTAIVLGTVAVVIVLLGYARFRAPY